jgi:hypothetical protein
VDAASVSVDAEDDHRLHGSGVDQSYVSATMSRAAANPAMKPRIA